MKLGIIGCGNMAKAILSRIASTPYAETVLCYDVQKTALENLCRDYDLQPMDSGAAVAAAAQILILAVKPRFHPAVIEEIRAVLTPAHCVVTLAPGLSLDWLARSFQIPKLPILRTMPNTPAMVGAGMTALCPNPFVTQEQLRWVEGLFQACGKTQEVPEYLIPAVVSVSGSAPAYIYLLIEAMADGAVSQGMPRQQAYDFAAQAVLGSAKMVLETKMHPGALKDQVCSPGGTTIAAVAALEEAGFRSALLKAMAVCGEKAREA